MPFMQPDIQQGSYFSVETTHGTEIVPADLIHNRSEVYAHELITYLEGEPRDPDETLHAEEGWLARLSAPGYLDCTEWSAHKTEQEAKDYLEEMYGDDEGDGDA